MTTDNDVWWLYGGMVMVEWEESASHDLFFTTFRCGSLFLEQIKKESGSLILELRE